MIYLMTTSEEELAKALVDGIKQGFSSIFAENNKNNTNLNNTTQ